MRLHRFHGGLRLDAHKASATAEPVRTLAPAGRLVVPLAQHMGAAAEPLVSPGDVVLAGQPIGAARGSRSAWVHAPTSGVVVAVEDRPLPRDDGATGTCVVIDADGADRWQRLDALAADAPPDALLERLHAAGVVGLGGAAFPTALKLASAVDTLVVNGAECEPYIACDDMLLRERAAEVVEGTRILARVAGASRILLAVEDSMEDARAAVHHVLAGATDVELVGVPTIYPEGGERQLLSVLTGLEVPSGGLPRDVGIVVQNVGTAAAAWRAVLRGEALVSRLVTVTGRGVARPCTLDVRVGTPVAALVEAAGGYTRHAARLVVGGPMMGMALPNDALPVTKATNCVLVLGADDVRADAPELPCIRCGECSRVCPAQLLPQQLHWYIRARDWAEVRAHALGDCIECGCCAYVCPSRIPLVEQYRSAKSELHVQARDAERAERARGRHVTRTERLAEREAQRETALAARTATALAAAPGEDPVAAALARARAKRAPPGGSDAT